MDIREALRSGFRGSYCPSSVKVGDSFAMDKTFFGPTIRVTLEDEDDVRAFRESFTIQGKTITFRKPAYLLQSESERYAEEEATLP